MITTNLTGNLGNHMWQYAVCRTVAEKLGYEWGINSTPSHDYFQGENQMYFMNVDFGKEVSGITREFHENWPTLFHQGVVNITKLDPKIYDIQDNTVLLGHKGAKGGIFQSEDYLIERKSDVLDWFSLKQVYVDSYKKILQDKGISLDENLCIINFRGGEYRGLSQVILRREYWRDAIEHMKVLNKDMRFVIITDDPECAKEYMPFPITTLHVDIGFDFYVVNQAKWVIISNSSFSWWAAWMNSKATKIIAPKYWARHNISTGYWATGDIYTRSFDYLDREGRLFSYEECKKEALEFYQVNNVYEDLRLF